MARSSETLTQKEIDAYKKFCVDNNIVQDESEDGLRNGAEIGNYIAVTWGEDITPATLAVALDKLRDRIVFYTPAQIEYIRVAEENPAAANQLNAWFEKQNTLVKEGDLGLQNQTTLLNELRGREINNTTISVAIERAKAPASRFHAARRLHFVQAPRKALGTITEAARNDDGTPFLGDLVKNPDGSFRSKTYQEQAAERDAAERAKSQTQVQTTLSTADQQWKSMADGLLNDGHHGQQARVRAVYDHEVNEGSSWRKVYEACKREANAHSRTVRGSNGFMDEFRDSIRRQ